jgi:rhodanese-related sulfurtransferase
VIGAGVLIVLAGLGVFLFWPAGVVEVSASQANAKRQAGAWLLDVRTPEEWDTGHIPGSKLIPLADLPTRLAEVPRGREVVVVCRSGRRSKEAAELLQKAGYQGAVSLAGGLQAWTAAGYPVTTADKAADANKAVIYLFWGDGCPHCAAEKPFLEELAQRYPALTVRMYEIWYVPENQDLFKKMAAAYDFEPGAVPTTFVGAQHWEGFGESLKAELEAAVAACLDKGCPDAGAGIVPGVAAASAPAGSSPAAEAPAPKSNRLELPLVGMVDLDTQSLTVSTLLISFVDGFNPCSMWVLSMLLALTLHTGSRRKVLLIGLEFITITAGVYGVFILGLFSMLTIVSFLPWLQAGVSVLALVFAIVNIKDYFWYKEGLSFTISDKDKPGIYQQMRRVLASSDSLWAMLTATAALAVGVSLVEFSCTAGFPVLWTNLVSAQKITPLHFAALLGLYLLVYQLDELGLFFAAVFTLKAVRLEEKHGRILKLVGGMLMLTLAIVMLVRPALMNNLVSSVLIFGVALAGVGLVLVAHRRILPALGVRLGTEFKHN